MAQNVARLGVIFGMDSAEFESGLKKVGRGLDSIQDKMKIAGAVAIASFTAMTYKALQYSDMIADVAQANEVAVKTVMALSEGLAQNGGSAENAGKLLSSFTAKIDEASQGSKDAQETFARLGISLKDLGTKDMTSLFDQAITSLAGMDDAVTRNAVAMSIFGKASKGVDFVGLAEGTSHAREEFEAYAESVKKAGDLHDKLDAKATKTMVMFTNAFIPTLNDVFDALNKTGGAMESFFNFTGQGFKTLIVGVAGFASYMKIVGGVISDVASIWKDFIKGNDIDFSARMKNLENNINVEMGKAQEFANRIYYPEVYAPKEVKKEEFKGRQVKPYVDQAELNKQLREEERIRQGLAMAKLLSEEYQRQLQVSYETLIAKGRINNMTEKEKEIEEAVLKVREETSKKITDITDKIAEASAHDVNAKVIDAMKEQIVEIEKLGKKYEELTRIEITSQVEAQRSFSYGWNKAFRQSAEDAENYATLGTKAFETMSGNINSAIDNFVETGKLSMADFASSIIKELIKVELKMQAMALFRMGLSFVNGAFAPSQNLSIENMNPNAVLSPYAEGGEPDVGKPALVGEQGAEIFIPKRAGTIIPNNKISDMLGSGQTVNYNAPYIANMSAIDTQSGIQFLAKNKMTIWSVNQSASRSIPTSR
jgi:lambda family phage tail tape measure protein